MGLDLNLLPNKEKEVIRWRKNETRILLYGTVLDIILIIPVLLLVGVLFLIKIQLADLDYSLNIENSAKKNEAGQVETLIKQTNDELDFLSGIAYGQMKSSAVLDMVAAILPESSGVYLKSFSFNCRSGEIQIAGFSPAREHVLAIKDRLEKSDNFGDIAWPLTNFTRENNINFSFTFSLKNNGK